MRGVRVDASNASSVHPAKRSRPPGSAIGCVERGTNAGIEGGSETKKPPGEGRLVGGGMQWVLMAVQAAIIVTFTVGVAIDTNDPGTTLGAFVAVTLLVWFFGALLANLWDWLRFRAFKLTRPLPRNAEKLDGESLGGRRNAVLLGEPPKDARRIAARE